MSDPIRQRPRSEEFFTTAGQRRMTGEDMEGYYKFSTKERHDNAADKVGCRKIVISTKMIDSDAVLSTVWDDCDSAISEEDVRKMFQFDKAPSSKRGLKILTSGTLGNAIQCMIGMTWILWQDVGKMPEYAFSVKSGGLEHRVAIDDHKILKFFDPLNCDERGTAFSLVFPRKHIEELLPYIEIQHALNPHIEVSIEDRVFRTRKTLPRLSKEPIAKRRGDGVGSVHCYTLEEFRLLATDDFYARGKVRDFVSHFDHFRDARYAADALHAARLDGTRITGSYTKDEFARLYGAMKACKDPEPRNLPTIGKNIFLQYFGPDIRYACRHEKISLGDGTISPCAVEVVSFPNSADLYECANFSVNLGRPFSSLNYPLERGKFSLSNLQVESGRGLLVHLVSPNIPWSDEAKRNISLNPFVKTIALAVNHCLAEPKTKIPRDRIVEDVVAVMNNNPDITYTIRGIFYQLISHYGYPNKRSFYNMLSRALVDGRDSGRIEAERIADFTREPILPDVHDDLISGFWTRADQFTRSAKLDIWKRMPERVLVMVEKDALSRVLAKVCTPLLVPVYPCKGYISYSMAYDLVQELPQDKPVVIIYVGDHDPAGFDIQRNLEQRLRDIARRKHRKLDLKVIRVALNIDQIRERNLPPFRMKKKANKKPEYISRFETDDVWEVDALDPSELQILVREEIERHIDKATLTMMESEENKQRRKLFSVIASIRKKM